jgi:hypothetical protein
VSDSFKGTCTEALSRELLHNLLREIGRHMKPFIHAEYLLCFVHRQQGLIASKMGV